MLLVDLFCFEMSQGTELFNNEQKEVCQLSQILGSCGELVIANTTIAQFCMLQRTTAVQSVRSIKPNFSSGILHVQQEYVVVVVSNRRSFRFRLLCELRKAWIGGRLYPYGGSMRAPIQR